MTDISNKHYAELITKRNTLLLYEKLINLALAIITFILSTPFVNNLWQKALNSKSNQVKVSIPKDRIYVLNGYNTYIVNKSTGKAIGGITSFVSDKGYLMVGLMILAIISIFSIIISSILFNKKITKIEIELHEY